MAYGSGYAHYMARKNPAAVQLGKKGGKASAKVRLSNISESDAKAIGSKLATARWEKWRLENPEKAAEAEKRRKDRKAKEA